MSTKTSTLGAATSATSATTSSAVGGSAHNLPMHPVNIKKELPNDEIKEFAENTMNELLGWYGFDGVDRLDLSAKSSRLLQAASNAGHTISPHHHIEKRRSRGRATTLLQLQQQNEHFRNITNNNNSINNNNNNKSSSNNNNNNNNNNKSAICNNYRDVGNSALGGILGGGGGVGGGGGGGAGGGGNETTISDHDTRSSRDDDSKSPHSTGKTTMEEKIDFHNCCWCRRPVPENAPEFLTTTDGPPYCSESCFAQSRRASFKKAKTCDWCKHVRHAVSYVDFQDGASQLQFCSDKCLNQYKMQIFCKETQAHLDMNPHLRDQGLEAVAAGNGASLITPDLWLRNCRSRSASPASTISVSPGPSLGGPIALQLCSTSMAVMPDMAQDLSPSLSPPNCIAAGQLGVTTASTSTTSPLATVTTTAMQHQHQHHQQQQHKPMISVAPASKLMMSKSPSLMQHQRPSPKHNRKKRPVRACVNNAEMGGGALKAGHPCGSVAPPRSDLSSQSGLMGQKSKPMLLQVSTSNHQLRTSPAHMAGAGGSGAVQSKSTPSSLSQFVGSSVQDLHMSVPPLSPMDHHQIGHHPHPHTHSHPHPHQHPHALPHRPTTSLPPAFFATQPNGPPPPLAHTPNLQMPPAGYPPRPAFMQNHGAAGGMHPRFFGGFGAGMQQTAQPPPPPPPPPPLPSYMVPPAGFDMWGGPPPVTVMVPYPVIIPLPVPIPIPLPVLDFYKAYLSPEERARFDERERLRSSHGPSTAPKAEPQQQDAQDDEDDGGGSGVASDEPLDFTKTKDYNIAGAGPLVEREETSPIPAAASRTPNEDSHASLEVADGHSSASLTPAPTTDSTDSPQYRIVDMDTPRPVEEQRVDHVDDSTDTTASTSTTTTAYDDAKQQLPKFKITRLQAKRSLASLQSREAECSRPLRKRKRIIDCDFQRIALKEGVDADDTPPMELIDTSPTSPAVCHKASTGKK